MIARVIPPYVQCILLPPTPSGLGMIKLFCHCHAQGIVSMVSVQPALTYLLIAVVLNSSIIAQYESSICFLLEHQLLSYSSYSDSQHTTFSQVTSFSACVCMCVLSCIWLFEAPWTVVCQAPVSMDFSRQRIMEWVAISYSRGSARPRIEPAYPALAGRFFSTAPPGKPQSSHQAANLSTFPSIFFSSLDLLVLQFRYFYVFSSNSFPLLTLFSYKSLVLQQPAQLYLRGYCKFKHFPYCLYYTFKRRTLLLIYHKNYSISVSNSLVVSLYLMFFPSKDFVSMIKILVTTNRKPNPNWLKKKGFLLAEVFGKLGGKPILGNVEAQILSPVSSPSPSYCVNFIEWTLFCGPKDVHSSFRNPILSCLFPRNSQVEVLSLCLISLKWGNSPSLNQSTQSEYMLISLNHSVINLGPEDFFKYA